MFSRARPSTSRERCHGFRDGTGRGRGAGNQSPEEPRALRDELSREVARGCKCLCVDLSGRHIDQLVLRELIERSFQSIDAGCRLFTGCFELGDVLG